MPKLMLLKEQLFEESSLQISSLNVEVNVAPSPEYLLNVHLGLNTRNNRVMGLATKLG